MNGGGVGGCDDGGGGAREIRMPRHEDAAGAILSLLTTLEGPHFFSRQHYS